MSIRNLFNVLTTSATDLVEGTAKIGGFIGEHLNSYAEDKAIRDLERTESRESRLADIAKRMAKNNLTDEDVQIIKQRHERMKGFLNDLNETK